RDVHEEVDVRDEVALAHAERPQTVEEVVTAVVHVPRVLPEPADVALGAAGAAQRVVAAAGVADDRREHGSLARQQARSGGEEDVVLGAHGVGRAVTVRGVVRVVEEGVDGLVALEVDDAQDVAPRQDVGPRLTGADDDVDDRGRDGALVGLGRGHKTAPATAEPAIHASVFSNPRTASGDAVRHGSSGAGGGPCHTVTCSRPGRYSGEGSSTCGVADSTARTFISARRSTPAPGRCAPSTQSSEPFGPTVTPAKRLKVATTSRRSRPWRPSAATRLSRALRW